jgi:Zn-dependent protease
VLAVFNLFPVPPRDGGRILLGILPKAIGTAVARLEPYGLAILIGLLIILPMLGAQLGVDLNFLSHLIAIAANAIIEAIVRVTSNS